ncbi:MAG: efflux RND transporter periplasmic adaptor subunit [Planctomycetota bacterium]
MRLPQASYVSRALLPLVALVGLASGAISAEEKQMLATVEKKDLPIEVAVPGMFQAEDKERIAIEPEEYSGDLIIKWIVAEGTAVKKGDSLLEFEVDTLKKAIGKAENEVDDATVELRKAEADLEALKIDQAATLQRILKELELAQLAVEAEQQLTTYKVQEKETEIERRVNSVRDKEVNFEQLKRLYEGRELHTETEAILVEREAKSLEEAKQDLQKLRRDYEHFKKYELYVELEKKKLEVLKQEAEKKKQDVKFAADLGEKEAAVRKAQRGVEEAKEKVAKLQTDLQNLKVPSPRDGIVFYGTIGSEDLFADVVVFTSGSFRQNLRIGGRVKTHETLLTVASMEKLAVEMKVLENDIQHMKEGLQVSIRPDAFPDLQIKGTINTVDQIAKRGGLLSTVQEFQVKASYEGTYPQLRAGMNCRVTVHADSVPEALQVPVIAVFEEEGRHYCYLEDAGKAAKREVKLGATNGKVVQIVEGLRTGDKVYLYDPFRS